MTELEAKLNNLRLELTQSRLKSANASVNNDLKLYKSLKTQQQKLLDKIVALEQLIAERE